jgi:hypothetical protein
LSLSLASAAHGPDGATWTDGALRVGQGFPTIKFFKAGEAPALAMDTRHGVDARSHGVHAAPPLAMHTSGWQPGPSPAAQRHIAGRRRAGGGCRRKRTARPQAGVHATLCVRGGLREVCTDRPAALHGPGLPVWVPWFYVDWSCRGVCGIGVY